MTLHGIELDSEFVHSFCKKWRIRELDVFGSILRDDFCPDSDVDFLVRFEESSDWDVTDLDAMERDLCGILGRKVEIIERDAVEKSPNYIRRRNILSTAKPVYAQ